MNPATDPIPHASSAIDDFDPSTLTRPDNALLTYYLIFALCTVFGFPFVFLVGYLKFRTLQYRFDDKGVAMSWGMFFRREIYLTYRRVQDIHVTRNLIHRWLGLSALSLQTASGGSGAEMTIEGIRQPERLRDYLYAKMRGARDDGHAGANVGPGSVGEATSEPDSSNDEALILLREIRDNLQRARQRGGMQV